MSRPHRRGFTFIEIIVVVFILAVLLAISIPAIQHYNANQDVRTTGELLTSALQQARSSAMQSTVPVPLPSQSPHPPSAIRSLPSALHRLSQRTFRMAGISAVAAGNIQGGGAGKLVIRTTIRIHS